MSATVWVNGPYRAFRASEGVCLVVPVPECGWLCQFEHVPEGGREAWRESARAAAVALGVGRFRRLHVESTVRRSSRDRFTVAEDVRPSLRSALEGLSEAGVVASAAEHRHVSSSLMVMGASTGDLGGLLVLRLREVSGG